MTRSPEARPQCRTWRAAPACTLLPRGAIEGTVRLDAHGHGTETWLKLASTTRPGRRAVPRSPACCSRMPRPGPMRRRCGKRTSASGRQPAGGSCVTRSRRSRPAWLPKVSRVASTLPWWGKPAAPLCGDDRYAGDRRHSGAPLPGCGRPRTGLRFPERRDHLCAGRRPGADRQDAGGGAVASAAQAHRLRRPARDAQLPPAGADVVRIADRAWPRLPAVASRAASRSRSRSCRRTTRPRCSTPPARPAMPRAWSIPIAT